MIAITSCFDLIRIDFLHGVITMQVMMIGGKGSGKTTFMAGMYKKMTEESKFSIEIFDSEKRQKLEELGEKLIRGGYPAPNDFAQTYDFYLKAEGSYLFPFGWYDYRGGIITTYNPNDPEAQEFDTKCKNCDAMIVFIDSTMLLDSGFNRYWRQMKETIERFACTAAAHNHKTLSIVLTKCDEDMGYDISLSRVWEQIFSFVDELREYEYIHGLVAGTHINRNIIFPVDKVFMWTMRLNFLKQCQACSSSAAIARWQSFSHNPSLETFFGAVGRVMNGETPKWVVAENQAAQAEKLRTHFNNLETTFGEKTKKGYRENFIKGSGYIRF